MHLLHIEALLTFVGIEQLRQEFITFAKGGRALEKRLVAGVMVRFYLTWVIECGRACRCLTGHFSALFSLLFDKPNKDT